MDEYAISGAGEQHPRASMGGIALHIQIGQPSLLDTSSPPLRSQARPSSTRIPRATYRLQFHAGFTFRDAQALVEYLSSLGISDVYASPYLRARSGSAHGYDVADPNSLNPEIGTDEEHAALSADLARRGMGLVLDVVPNHMGIGDASNTWWLDVLENGPSSIFANFFDIEWNPLVPEPRDRDKVILPLLGDQYGWVMENGELSLSYEDGAFWLSYYEMRLPIEPRSYSQLLAHRLADLETRLGIDEDNVLELQSIITALDHLPPRGTRDPKKTKERNREKEIIKRRISRLYQDSADFRQSLGETLAEFNGTKGNRRSFDLLDRLLDEQAYRLAFWRVASEEINYRRFFDISELAALRMEDPAVFRQTHRLLLNLVQAGRVTGLRIDHPDGLWDPAGYFWRLQRHCYCLLRAAAAPDENARPDNGKVAPDADELAREFEEIRQRDPDSPLLRPMYIVVEKILSEGEWLSESWPVHGTTGYDFLNQVNGLFVDRANRRAFDAIYGRFAGSRTRYRDIANSNKKMVMLISLASEINQLAYLLKRIASKNPRSRDFTLNGLTFAIREIIASLSVYRTYIDPVTGRVGERDVAYMDAALSDARRRNPRTDPSIFQFVHDTVLLKNTQELDAADLQEQLRFVSRFQQTTGPVMAKGVEDTTFYVYNRLVSLNDVGGEPDTFGISVNAFHRVNAERLRRWPASLLASSTHDTKRSEDVRARINVLSEVPREWNAALTRWSRLNARKKHTLDGRPAPDRNEEYLFYQVLLGVWPLQSPGAEERESLTQRLIAFMTKAMREGKVNTSWINVNAAYEEAVEQFVRVVLDTAESAPFLDDFSALAQKVAHFGVFNALSQTLLKLTSPGVPDIYQGDEVWDFSLVDPDNRRPVDYATRAHLLAELQQRAGSEQDLPLLARELVKTRQDGRIKLFLTHRSLTFRQENEDLFRFGSYRALRTGGSKRAHVCAFAREENGRRALVVAPVLVAGLTRGLLDVPVGEPVWEDTWIGVGGPSGDRYRDVFTGRIVEVRAIQGQPAVRVGEVLGDFPAALLHRM